MSEEHPVSAEFASPWTNLVTFAEPTAGWSAAGRGLTQLATAMAGRGHGAPLPAGDPTEVLAAVAAELGRAQLPEQGIGAAAALDRLADVIARYGIDLTHKLTAAHLQPPPLTVAVIADALASASNASLDTYDSGPATLAIERWAISTLIRLVGFSDAAGGVFGPGGSYSNLLGLLVARDHTAARHGFDIRRHGVRALPRPVVLCSQLTHFSIHRACAALGLGEQAVRPVPVGPDQRMIPEALDAELAGLTADELPVAIVATAGTTDFGSVDPLPEIAAIAARYRVWLHVDAAYGFGSLFSDRLAPLLTGIDRADSITLDLHKVGWQPAAAGVLLLSEVERFASLSRSVAYLNPDDDIEAGYGGLLGQTLQTTRRPDALKVAATFLTYGRRGLGEMLDTCHDIARYAERRIVAEPQLELIAPATMTTVVFRYRCEDLDLDQVNAELRRRLISSGIALIGRTDVRVRGDGAARTCLKLTLLNPEATETDIDALFDQLRRVGLEVESEGLPDGQDEMVTARD
ncbi:pyridoxal phosphate-dependent decarboxylase family protein [Skermania piniformis]|uniref:pyridoxal phosphate-dependent decarboxylase family protein n=1 Tax=Skermania pinensis TaxID=39122 RepID=UPI000A5384B2|nr:pyridoxal-dependent decarboxylase [Skermania piniformis]